MNIVWQYLCDLANEWKFVSATSTCIAALTSLLHKDAKRFSATRATARDAYWRLENLQIDLEKFTRWIKEGVRRAAGKDWFRQLRVSTFSGFLHACCVCRLPFSFACFFDFLYNSLHDLFALCCFHCPAEGKDYERDKH